MNAYKRWVRAVWFENGREVKGVAPDTWIKRGTVFWPKGTNAEPAYLDREEPNEKTWRSFKLVKVKFTSDKEEDCHEYDATTAEEGDDQDNRRGVKKKKEEDFLYETDEADGDRKLNKILRRLSSSKKKQREDMQSAINILVPPIPPCTPSRTNEPPTEDEDSDYEDIYVDEVDSQMEEVPDSSMSKGKRPGKKLNKSSFPMTTATGCQSTRRIVERGQQNSLYYAAKQFTHIHEFPDLYTEDKQLWIKRWQALGGRDPREMFKNTMKRCL
ncbi:hypothetical protein CAPTEDRAFT_202719 [Capitella teleta]|uniref:Uncharacterized protein n=1 Tax=Capitella teleta TaxID=283909 RepID=R7UHA5_CAPTE|nr:hypothetical protein CAPTEDRAFT_202719 [Capitella teleta]|eukprot:ELU05473.1 hypothetical protein CAPTEDRAFT_202719 [Capitella teleta]